MRTFSLQGSQALRVLAPSSPRPGPGCAGWLAALTLSWATAGILLSWSRGVCSGDPWPASLYPLSEHLCLLSYPCTARFPVSRALSSEAWPLQGVAPHHFSRLFCGVRQHRPLLGLRQDLPCCVFLGLARGPGGEPGAPAPRGPGPGTPGPVVTGGNQTCNAWIQAGQDCAKCL